MENQYVWVIPFDKETGERVGFVRCGKSSASFHAENYKIDGYDVKIMNDEEIETLIEHEKDRV